MENPHRSDIWDAYNSPLRNLNGPNLTSTSILQRLDQCQFGATIEEQPIKKATDLLSNHRLTQLRKTCCGEHKHLHLRGSGQGGSRTALSAVYPTALCHTVLETIDEIGGTQRNGGRISINLDSFRSTLTDKHQVLRELLSELRVHALRQGRMPMRHRVVDPWIDTIPGLQIDQTRPITAECHFAVHIDAGSDGGQLQPAAEPHQAQEANRPSKDGHAPLGSHSGLPEVSAALADIQQQLRELRACGGQTAGVGVGDWEMDTTARPSTDQPETAGVTQRPPETTVTDLITGTLPDQDGQWQFQPFDGASATWLAAAQRRHMHRRRLNASTGVASVDLSGPHEPTPLVGLRLGQRSGHYYVVLTIKPTEGPTQQSTATQTEHDS